MPPPPSKFPHLFFQIFHTESLLFIRFSRSTSLQKVAHIMTANRVCNSQLSLVISSVNQSMNKLPMGTDAHLRNFSPGKCLEECFWSKLSMHFIRRKFSGGQFFTENVHCYLQKHCLGCVSKSPRRTRSLYV